MKAAIMGSVGQPLIVEEVDIATPGPFEVLIEVSATGLCHSDLVFLDGSYPLTTPAVLGHESSGVVLETGGEVTGVSPGDRVITSLSASCGVCEYCAEGRSHLCSRKEMTRRRPDQPPRLARGGEPVHQFLDLSAFAERMLVHESTVVKAPRSLASDRAALLGCGVATGLGSVFNTAGVDQGQSVAIVGCGGVGLAAVQGARIAGASPIVAVDVVAHKLALAASMGATHVVNAAESDPVEAVREITRGSGVHHAIEAIGSTQTAGWAFAMLRRGGAATIVGLIPGQTLTVPTDELFYERRIQGCVMGSNDFRRDVPRYIEMYLDGRLNLDDMVTERLGLEEINRGFEKMRAGEAVRSMIVFEDSDAT